MIVSNGVGTSTIPPIRLFCRPQIVVITLEHGAADRPTADSAAHGADRGRGMRAVRIGPSAPSGRQATLRPNGKVL